MNIQLLWVVDPKDGKPSVSLTNLIVSIVYLITMGVLQTLGKVADTGMAMEYYGISASLYFGRRINFNKNSTDIQSDNNQEENK